MLNIFILVLFLMGAGLIFATYLAGMKIISRRDPDRPATPAEFGMKSDAVLFDAADDVNLNGWWIPAKEPTTKTVIQCHGQNGSMDADLPIAQMLHDAGLNVFMFNFRAHGTSDGRFVTYGIQEKADILGAIEHLKKNRKIQRIGVLGLSMGAMAALHTATESTDIACVVADGATGKLHTTLTNWLIQKGVPKGLATPYMRFALRYASAMSKTNLSKVDAGRWTPMLQCPTLFIHGADDEFISQETIKRIVKKAQTPTELWIAPNCRHREAHLKYCDEYRQRVVGWFQKYLP